MGPKQNKNYMAGICVRLSRDDERAGESLSIENQKILVTKYVGEKGWEVKDVYVDDGYSGTNFERPGVKRLLDDAKTGEINTIILDLYGDRKVVAYKISKKNNIPLVIDTLNEAIAKTKDVTNLIIYSDQGFQYTSFEYKAICESNGITISMNRRGTPLDDSPMESFHGILKKRDFVQ